MGHAICRLSRATTLLLAASVLSSAAAQGATLQRFTASREGMVLELSAPRPDILRVRIGRSALPEDASWAVPAASRAAATPMEVVEDPAATVISTTTLKARLDKSTWRLTVTDPAGRILLDEPAEGGLDFRGRGFALHKVMPADAHYFGLGDKTGGLDRRGQAFTLWNTDAFGFGEASDPLYKSIPFVLGADEAGHAFGLLLDNTWRSFFDFGKTERDTLSFGAEGGPIDYYVMAGPDPKTVVREYAWLTGAAPLAPLWALGFQQSRYSYMNEPELRGVADRLRADHIPSDVLYMDIDYQEKNRPFTVNTMAYPDLTKMFADLRAMNLRVVMITDLHIADAPGAGYAPYDTGKAGDVFLKRPDGADYVGLVWPGRSVFPDFSRATVRDWWGGLYADFHTRGAAGFWNDMNEPAIFQRRDKTMPLDTVHHIDEPGFAPRAASHAEMHNVYGMLNSRGTYEGLLKIAPDERPFVLTRASYAGGQRFAATWTGDNSSTWNHLRLSIPQLVNLGLSGFGYSGDDIGGFGGSPPSADLLTRWIEIGAFSPIFRDHVATDKPHQEVWVHGPDHEAIRRRYIEERYRLMPYLYALAEENSHDGLPLMRPVFLESPEVLARGWDFGGSADQFMLGGDLLIAPPPVMETPADYRVRLPGPQWYDYWSGLQVVAQSVLETPALDRLPVFVRPGAIIPRQPLVQSTGETPKGSLRLDVYRAGTCSGTTLYLDDGVSFAFRRGIFLRQSVSCASGPAGLSVSFGPREGSFKPWWRGFTIVIHGWPEGLGAQATLNGKATTSIQDTKAQTVTLELPDISRAGVLQIGGRDATSRAP